MIRTPRAKGVLSCLFEQTPISLANASMFSSDNASYSWYYTTRFWAPWWAKQIYMVFPTEGMLVMNNCRELYIAPCYEYKCNNPTCPAPMQIHSFRFSTSAQAKGWFMREDWSKRNTVTYYDDVVLTMTFTGHAGSLSMVARPYYLF